jgi:thiosulfate dehydrogenase
MLICAGLTAAWPGASARAEGGWIIPDITTLPDDEAGRLVRQGKRLIGETYRLIGPEVPSAAKQKTGNNLACRNCHLDDGTRKFGLPLLGQGEGIEDKINFCMTRSMNGRPLDSDSPEMKAITAYLAFISSAMPAVESAKGGGRLLAAAPGSPEDGKRIFAQDCANCHRSNGLGRRNGQRDDAGGYLAPPLWGPDSFSAKSPLAEPAVLASYIYANMPLEAFYDRPLLSPQDAANVAAFILAAPRPE